MKKSNKIRLTVVIILSLIGVTLLSRAIGLVVSAGHHQAALTVVPPAADQPLVYDTVLVGKFNSLLRSMDFNKDNCFYSGIINLTDGKDSSNNIHDLHFLFSKQGKITYYHLGHTETLNHDGLNVFIDHDNKKIAVSGQRFEAGSPIKTTALIVSQLRSENYSLQSVSTGGLKRIFILNEKHVTCKEMSVTFDTLTNKLKDISTRFTDITDISSKSKERIVNIRIDRQEDTPAAGGALPVVADVIKKENGKWSLRDKYANYELIIL